jgi:hypothetical protein
VLQNEKKMKKTLNCKRKTLNPTNAQNLEGKKNLVGVGHNFFSPTQILEVGGS